MIFVSQHPVWLLTNPRVGSSYLASLLNSTGLFDPVFQEHYWQSFRFPVVLEKLPRYNKIHFHQYKNCLKDNNLEKSLPGIKYIRLKRKDHVSVAVSLYIGFCLNQFSVTSEDLLNTTAVEYNESGIRRFCDFSKSSDAGWDAYLETRDSLEFEYEDLVSDPQEVVGEILRYARYKDCKVDFKSHITKKMHHPQKEEFVERFRPVG